MGRKLAKVVEVIEDNCVNCHACIRACPVRFCNDGSGDHVAINDDMCIGCGQCIKACTHEARLPVDDFDRFMKNLKVGRRIIAVVAPAVAAQFPDQYLNLNGWLKSIGVQAFFDVSFGAELTVQTYLDHITRNKPSCVIAQPCPAIVSFIQIYKPELLPYLAPADSPMLHTVRMIKEFYPEYANASIAIISPCMAKKREFDETGLGDYNVTIGAIQKYMKDHNVRLSSCSPVEYSNPPAERAVLFSTPGGLLQTLKRWVPEADGFTRKIEGPEIVYEYLEHLPASIKKGVAPLLVDCLNCDAGCNGGTAVGGCLNEEYTLDELEANVARRNRQMCEKYRSIGPFAEKRTGKHLEKLVKKYWKPGLYDRKYKDLRDHNVVAKISNNELIAQYHNLNKHEEKDFYDCGACGYTTCKEMATALHFGLAKPTQCFHYSQDHLLEISNTFDQSSTELAATVEEISVSLNQVHEHSRSVSEKASLASENAVAMGKHSAAGRLAMEQILKAMAEIQDSSKQTSKILKVIEDIAFQTNLLALNASVEAARAGRHGKGFAVVADEVRNLAGRSGKASKETETFIQALLNNGETGSKIASEASQTFGNIVSLIEKAAQLSDEILKNTQDQTVETGEINNALAAMSSSAQEKALKATELKAKIASGIHNK